MIFGSTNSWCPHSVGPILLYFVHTLLLHLLSLSLSLRVGPTNFFPIELVTWPGYIGTNVYSQSVQFYSCFCFWLSQIWWNQPTVRYPRSVWIVCINYHCLSLNSNHSIRIRTVWLSHKTYKLTNEARENWEINISLSARFTF